MANSKPPKRKVLHLISQAHLDPVWLWPVRDGCAEALTTLQSAVDRAAETPEFKFTRSSAVVYRWARDMDPRLMESIRALVRKKRWEVIGGWVEQPDCNLPSTESFIRNGVYAQSFFLRELGCQARIGYNVDSFGHGGGLPQILKGAGMDHYVYMRPNDWDATTVPQLFWWEGPDGSRVLTQRVPGVYSQSYATRADDLEAYLRIAANANFVEGFDDGIFWLGVGNHGGGPTREHIARIRCMQGDESLPELRFSTVGDYFAAVRKSAAFKKLPVHCGELQFHARGCYAATGEVKSLHRASEMALQLAESALVLGGAKRQADEIKEAWWRLLFNEFHDILAGSCTAQTLGETRERFGSVLTVGAEVALRETLAIARKVDTRNEKGSTLFVLNPLPWKRTALVQLDTFISPHGTEEITHLQTLSGKRVKLQWMDADANFGPWNMQWGKLTAVVQIPAAGYRVFRIGTRRVAARKGAQSASQEQFPEGAVSASPVAKHRGKMEPVLKSLLSPGRRELLESPIGVVILEDKSDAWGHEIEAFDKVIGRPRIVSSEILEHGPLVTIWRQKSLWQASEIWMDVIRYAHTPQVELRFRINWQEKRQIAKLEIPTRLRHTEVFAKMPGEAARRPAGGDEHPCQDWVAVEGRFGSAVATLGVLNNSSYSYDVRGGTLRMILTRSAPHAEHRPFKFKDETNAFYMDQGWQERRFWLVCGDGGWNRMPLDRLAREWQIPLQAVMDSGHAGTEAWEKFLLEVGPQNIAVLALKPAEEGKGTILRVQETSGQKTVLRGNWKGRRFSLNLSSWEIKTVLLTDARTSFVREVSASEGRLRPA